MATDLTRGPITRTLISLAFPTLGMLVLQQAYMYIDMACVGRLGKNALAAVVVGNVYSTIIFTISMAFTRSVLHFISSAISRRDYEEANALLFRIFTLATATGVLFSAAYFIFVERLVGIMAREPEVIRLAVQYFTLISLMPAIALPSMTIITALRADGDTRTSFWISAVTNAIDAVLCVLLVFGFFIFPRLGIRGAALAALISRFLSLSVLMTLVLRGYGNLKLTFPKSGILPARADASLFLKHFFPSLGEGILRGFNTFFIVKIVSPFGAAGLSTMMICQRIIYFLGIFSNSLESASSAIMGQSLGIGAVKRGWQSFRQANVLYLSLAATGIAAMILFPGFFINLFIHDPEVLAIGRIGLRILAFSALFFGVINLGGSGLNVSGNPFWSMLIALAGNYLIQLPLAYVLSRFTRLGLYGIWIADVSTHVVQGAIFLFIFITGLWHRKYRRARAKEWILEGAAIQSGTSCPRIPG